MAEFEGTPQIAGFTDRKTRLLVFGILQILFGGLCALLIPLMIFSMVMSATMNKDAANPVDGRMMIPGIGFYAAMAAWFIVMGIGSIRARRWARALVLVSSWLWLVCGVGGFVCIVLLMPAMYDQVGKDGKIPEAMIVGMKIGMLTFAAVFYIVIPGLLVLFYSGRDVKATCETRDPHVRWTDKCPLPVLGMSLMCTGWAFSLLYMGAYGWVLPFFGTILSGLPGAVVIFALLLLFAYTAYGLYKLDIKAWWCALLINVGWLLSTVITFSRVGMQAFYEKMNIPAQQMEQMKQFTTLWEQGMYIPLVIWLVVVGVYLLYIRKYFKSNLAGVLAQSYESK
jgi:hypothetical protein